MECDSKLWQLLCNYLQKEQIYMELEIETETERKKEKKKEKKRKKII